MLFAQSNQMMTLLSIHLMASLTICSDLSSNVLPCVASKGGRNCFSFTEKCLLWFIRSHVKWWYWSRDLNLNSVATEQFFISNELNSSLDHFLDAWVTYTEALPPSPVVLPFPSLSVTLGAAGVLETPGPSITVLIRAYFVLCYFEHKYPKMALGCMVE